MCAVRCLCPEVWGPKDVILFVLFTSPLVLSLVMLCLVLSLLDWWQGRRNTPLTSGPGWSRRQLNGDRTAAHFPWEISWSSDLCHRVLLPTALYIFIELASVCGNALYKSYYYYKKISLRFISLFLVPILDTSMNCPNHGLLYAPSSSDTRYQALSFPQSH